MKICEAEKPGNNCPGANWIWAKRPDTIVGVSGYWVVTFDSWWWQAVKFVNCVQPEEVETLEHFLLVCPSLQSTRN